MVFAVVSRQGVMHRDVSLDSVNLISHKMIAAGKSLNCTPGMNCVRICRVWKRPWNVGLLAQIQRSKCNVQMILIGCYWYGGFFLCIMRNSDTQLLLALTQHGSIGSATVKVCPKVSERWSKSRRGAKGATA